MVTTTATTTVKKKKSFISVLVRIVNRRISETKTVVIKNMIKINYSILF